MCMNRTISLTASSIAVLLSIGVAARAQTGADIQAVTAANNAFYTAVSTLDAAAMEKVWAQEFYVNNIGPRSKEHRSRTGRSARLRED